MLRKLQAGMIGRSFKVNHRQILQISQYVCGGATKIWTEPFASYRVTAPVTAAWRILWSITPSSLTNLIGIFKKEDATANLSNRNI